MAFGPEQLKDVGLLFFIGGSSDYITGWLGSSLGGMIQGLAPFGALAFVGGAVWAMWR